MTDTATGITTKRLPKVAVGKLRPNRWNPNRESEFIFERVRASLEKWGMVTPPVVRAAEDEGFYDIIGGEHRWRAWVDLGHKHTPVDLVEMEDGGPVPDHLAQRLGLMLNVHGEPDDMLLADLLTELSKAGFDLASEVPFTAEELSRLVGLDEPFDFGGTSEKGENEEPAEPWSTLTWDLPAAAAKVVMQAVRKAQGDDEHEWMGLERVAADYLAGPDV